MGCIITCSRSFVLHIQTFTAPGMCQRSRSGSYVDIRHVLQHMEFISSDAAEQGFCPTAIHTHACLHTRLPKVLILWPCAVGSHPL